MRIWYYVVRMLMEKVNWKLNPVNHERGTSAGEGWPRWSPPRGENAFLVRLLIKISVIASQFPFDLILRSDITATAVCYEYDIIIKMKYRCSKQVLFSDGVPYTLLLKGNIQQHRSFTAVARILRRSHNTPRVGRVQLIVMKQQNVFAVQTDLTY